VSKIGEYTEDQINEISEVQNAYFEFFYCMKFKPILLKEYVDELEGLRRYLELSSGYIYSQADIIENYVQMVGIEEASLRKTKAEGDIIQFLKDNLNNILAIASGVYSIGTERLSEIATKRLLYYQIVSL